MTTDFCPYGCYWDCEHRQQRRAPQLPSYAMGRPYQVSPNSERGRLINEMYDAVMEELDRPPQPGQQPPTA